MNDKIFIIISVFIISFFAIESVKNIKLIKSKKYSYHCEKCITSLAYLDVVSQNNNNYYVRIFDFETGEELFTSLNENHSMIKNKFKNNTVILKKQIMKFDKYPVRFAAYPELPEDLELQQIIQSYIKINKILIKQTINYMFIFSLFILLAAISYFL
ncbi:MAG: hypothetical protein RR073_05970 [Clostridia bacterium]